MESNIPRYRGKPTAYLDHNVLDLFVKKPDLLFKTYLKENFQVVFSDENLKEIKRTGPNGELFLNLLNEFDALYLKLVMNPSFELTGNATISEVSPFLAFDEYCKTLEPVYQGVESAVSQSLVKFFGGRAGSNFDNIADEQISAFNDLMESLNNTSLDIVEEGFYDKETSEELAELINGLKNKFKQAVDTSNNELRKYIDDEENFSGIKNYREATTLGPIQLNNIEPPHVLEKIWNEYKNLEIYKSIKSIEQFFGLSFNPIYNREYFFFEKVTLIYNTLNIIGYHPDSKLHKQKRFTAAMSDTSHASFGSFSDFLFSRDIAFTKKATAAYEFLQINTKVVELVDGN